MKHHSRNFVAALVTAGVLMLAGCDTSSSRSHVSPDMTKLTGLIDLNIQAQSVQWEIVGTPEYQGGVPGPTDFVTLVAEFNGASVGAQAPGSSAATTAYIVPNAARPWTSAVFQTFLAEKANTVVDIGALPHCRPYQTRLTKTGNSAHGFVCASQGRALLYVVLTSPENT
ncbi:hypothetical protein [Pseudoduganella ginsengisoli]|uniref:Uncharacterized protein n=1 Tax=Pseudoduganella ginsengisoli TaxID=1462440 RepID=A0A6L6PWG8_9BURK|nr:hypothetical protein [Pseudoduganella ginsengisoli]MTW01504.1 hypothetical protein [Pseudoduganella ginsengisoli]